MRRLDPFAVAAGVFLLLALAFGVYPAIRAGPQSLGGVLLLTGLAGVAFFAILALRSQRAGPAEGLEIINLIEAISQPVALSTADGRVLANNAAWIAVAGDGARLPKSAEQGGLFAAIGQARRGETGRVMLRTKAGPTAARLSVLDQRRYLVELLVEPALPVAKPAFGQSPPPLKAQRGAPAELDAFAAAAPFGAALLDGDDPATAAIVRANAALETMAGKGGLAGTRLATLIEAASWAEVAPAVAGGGPGPFELRLAQDPASIAQLYLTRGPGGLIAYLVDVSEQKQMELQLAQSEKMRAIGQLVCGVAHDFNNLLTAIPLRLDELSLRHPVGDPSYQGLVEIRSTADRAADLVRKLLAFSRKQTLQREVLELGGLVSEIEVLLRRAAARGRRLETDYGRNLPLVRIDRGQLETAVMNLVVNARDAVRAQGGGVVRIRTARFSLADARAARLRRPARRPGRGGADRGRRQRPRHPPRRAEQDLRSLLHHQAGGRGHGARPLHRLRHRQAGRRLDRGRLHAGRTARPSASSCRSMFPPPELKAVAPQAAPPQARRARPLRRRSHPVRRGRGHGARGGRPPAARPRL